MDKIKSLQVGKFHFLHDGSQTGHPGIIVWKSDERNLYLAIKIGTSPNKNNSLYCRPLAGDVSQSYIYRRLFLGKRKDFDSRELPNMEMSDEEVDSILESVDFDNPVFSSNLNRKDKRFYSWIVKRYKKIPFIRGDCQGTKPLRDANNIQDSNTKVNKNNEEINDEEKQEHKSNS